MPPKFLVTALVMQWMAGIGAAGLAAAQPVAEDNPLHLSPHHVTVVVADLNKEAAWYEAVLGFRETLHYQRADFEIRALAIPGYRFDLVWQKGSTRPPAAPKFYQQGYLHLVFATPTMDADYQWLLDHAIPVDAVRDDKTHALRAMTIHDPEGNEIEIGIP